MTATLIFLVSYLLAMPTQDSPPAAAGPETMPAWLHIGGQLRGRFEDPSGIGYVAGASDAYYLDRVRIDVLIKPLPWLRVFAQTQDSRAWGYHPPTQPASFYNPFDLRQAYVDLGSAEQKGPWLRIGRQELTLGSGRLVGVSDFTNVTRTFDLVHGAYSRSGVRVDLVAGSVVLVDPSRYDRHKPGEHLYGSYWTLSKVIPGASLEPYLLIKRAAGVTSEQGFAGTASIPTMGFRLIGKAPFRTDYAVEIVKQVGGYSTDRISALAASYVAGWRLNASSKKPRISAEYNHASGDHSSRDGTRQTFDQLYANNHPYYGMADKLGWRNMRNARVGFDMQITKKLKFQSDFNDFKLATVEDGVYDASGTRTVLNRQATSRHVGAEVDLQATCVWSKYLTFGGGVARLFRGEYLKQSVTSNGYLYPYATWTAAF